ASHTERVALRGERQTVRIVTVRTANTRLIHPALPEGTVLVHLAELLAVGVVEVGGEERGQVIVVERLARHRRGAQLRPARMARGADLDLGFGAARPQIDEALGWWAATPSCPGDVPFTGPVTRLAAHVDLRPGGGVTVGARVVVLAQVRRVTRGA